MCDTLIFCISYKKMTVQVLFRGALNIFALACEWRNSLSKWMLWKLLQMDEFFFPSHSWTNTFVKYTKNGLLEERNKKTNKLKTSNSTYYLIQETYNYISLNTISKIQQNRAEPNVNRHIVWMRNGLLFKDTEI